MADERPDLSGFGPEIAEANLTQLMWELVLGANDLGGGGQESDVEKQANRYRSAPIPYDAERPERSIHNHYAGGFDALDERGIFEKSMVGSKRFWWISDEAWRALGHDEPIVHPAELF